MLLKVEMCRLRAKTVEFYSQSIIHNGPLRTTNMDDRFYYSCS